MKNEIKSWVFFGFFSVLFFLISLGFSGTISALDSPDVILFFYKSDHISMPMLFDFKDSGLLKNKTCAREILQHPSEDIELSITSDGKGNFGFLISKENDNDKYFMIFGSMFFKIIGSGADEIMVHVFKQNGAGEPAYGGYGNDIWLLYGKEERKIGEIANKHYIAPDGQEKTDYFSRISGVDSPWLIQLDDKIYQRSDKGELSQVGWVEWRMITTNDGTQFVILMTKGMEKNSKWAGRYNGKLYRDK